MVDHCSTGGFSVLAAAATLAAAVEGEEGPEASLPRWLTEAQSAYIYGFQCNEACRRLLRLLTGDARADIVSSARTQDIMSVTSSLPEICGPMSGMNIPTDVDDLLVFDCKGGRQRQSIIKASDGDLFFTVEYKGVQVYVNACPRVVDVESLSPAFFDIKKAFGETVPVVMYLKWAFREVGWKTPGTSGCLIVDDPALRARYGFLRFRDALTLMEQHRFTTTIAFIPWNWRRTRSGTVELFRGNPDKLSLCVHGCDHTASELAARSTALLNRRIKVGIERMEGLFQRTSLQADRIMVFPQGAFSPESGRALKLNGYAAAVNTEVSPSNRAANETTIADVWDVATMKYGTFPIFTRRYITHGIENFAFDGILGKPCLIAAHHDAFREGGRELVDFISRLNSLQWGLRWRPLGDVISRSYKVRPLGDGVSAIQVFSSNLTIDGSEKPWDAVLMKKEGDPDCIEGVTVNQKANEFNHEGGCLRIPVKVPPRQMIGVRISYVDQLGAASGKDGLGYSIRTRARRYLSELRDDYISQSPMMHKGATVVRQFLKGA
jgi:hypothetical protein